MQNISHCLLMSFHFILAKHLNLTSSYANIIWVSKSQIFPTNVGFQSGYSPIQNLDE